MNAGKTAEDGLFARPDASIGARAGARLGMRNLSRTTTHTEWKGD